MTSLKRVKKPYSYLVFRGKSGKPRFVGGSNKLSGALRLAGKRGQAAIIKVARAWEGRAKPRKQKKHRRRRKH